MHAPPSTPADHPRSVARWWTWCVPALVAAATYLPALRNAFAYDDDVIVVGNGRMHQWATLIDAVNGPYWFDTGHLYRPLTTLSFGLEWILGGGSPMPFHVVNVLWHAVVSALVARLALRWWSPSAAFAAGLWFAIHPVHVEAVANVVGRSELVCAAALLTLALLASQVSRVRPAPVSRPDTSPAMPTDGPAARSVPSAPITSKESGRLLLAAALAAAAMASKETGVAAPVIAWAAAWVAVERGRTGDAARRRAWRLTAAAAFGVAVVIAARFALLGGPAGDDPHAAFRAATPVQGMLLALASLPRAIGLMLVPQLPHNDYSPTDAQLAHPNALLVLCGIALVAGALAVVLLHVRKPSPWTFAIVLATATLAPVSNLLVHTGVVIAERTLYAPSIAAALAMGAGMAVAWERRARLPLALAAAIAGAALLFTEASIPIWRDTPTAFAAMRARVPESYRGYSLLAARQMEGGNVAGAHESYRAAIARFSRDPVLLFHGGINALQAGDTASALRWLTQSVAADSAQLRARTALAMLCLHLGDTTRARTLLSDGLRIAPDQRSWRSTLDRLPPAPRAP